MASYYYLMAQLPAVQPGVPLSVPYESFKEIASRFLDEADKKILENLSLEPTRSSVVQDGTLASQWFERERALRLSLAKMRAARLKREFSISQDSEEEISRNFPSALAAKNAVAIESPLEAERYLDKVRLSWVEELRGNHFFDSDAVFAYALMVLLHERSDKFTVEAGRASYTSIYNQILGEQA